MTFDNFAYTVRKGETFTGATVNLDGNHFDACRFLNCKLVFVGDQPFSYTQCEFTGSTVIFEGRAKMVLSTIAHWYDDDSILAVVEQLRADLPTFN